MSSLPATYKAVVIKAAKAPFTIEEVPLRPPTSGEVLVKVLACGVCFSDVGIAHGEFGDVFPRIPGHELVGEVAALGPDVKGFTVGQRVGGPWHGGHDGSCRQCKRGRFQMCENELVNGFTKDGGFGEYAHLRAEAVVNVPADMDAAEVAPLLCAGVTVFNGIRKMNVQHGGLVAVQGLGGLGHLAVQYASKMGYEVVALSSGDDKEAFAKQLGAHHYVNTKTKDAAEELQKLGGADIIVQTAPNPAVVGPLINGLGPCGRLLSLAPVGPIEVNTVPLILKGLGVEGWPSGHAIDSEDAIAFAKNHGVKCMIEKYPFADVQKAVDDLLAGKPRFRNVLVFE